MNIAVLARRVVVIAAIVGLCACAAGCVSDMGASTAGGPGDHQLRYYGGPKYPMWSAQ
jgi:hypothetical protein